MSSIETDLKKEGIEVIKPLDTLTVNTIAKGVAEKLANRFGEQNLSYDDVFIKLSRLNMYVAKMPNGLSGAKYYYKNSSIYFNEDIDLTNIDIFAMHECIHYLQELKDTKNNLIHLGLCDFSNSKLPGMALNEAAVQLMSSKSLNVRPDVVKYFDINLPTCSPSHYALECNLINQMAYITGDYVLYNSTLYSNNSFKNKFVSLTNAKAFNLIQKNMDKLLSLEDELSNLTYKLENTDDTDKNIMKLSENINNLRNKIQQLFLKIQNLILTSYFDANFKNITTLEQIENYRRKLYNYKDLIGTTSSYTFFNDYYISKMAALEIKCNVLENALYSSNNNTALVQVKTNFITTLFNKIKKLFIKPKNYELPLNQ